MFICLLGLGWAPPPPPHFQAWSAQLSSFQKPAPLASVSSVFNCKLLIWRELIFSSCQIQSLLDWTPQQATPGIWAGGGAWTSDHLELHWAGGHSLYSQADPKPWPTLSHQRANWGPEIANTFVARKSGNVYSTPNSFNPHPKTQRWGSCSNADLI